MWVGKYIDYSIALQSIVQILIGSSKNLEYYMIHSGCSDNIVGHICQLFGIWIIIVRNMSMIIATPLQTRVHAAHIHT